MGLVAQQLFVLKDDSGQTCALIPTITGLTDAVKHKLKDLKIETICSRLQNSGIIEPNIEEILSHVLILQKVIGDGKIDDLNKKT